MSNTTFHFSLREAAEVEVDIYDMFGRPLLMVIRDHFESGPHEIVCQTSQLPTGHYIIRYRTTLGESRAMLLKL